MHLIVYGIPVSLNSNNKEYHGCYHEKRILFKIYLRGRYYYEIDTKVQITHYKRVHSDIGKLSLLKHGHTNIIHYK